MTTAGEEAPLVAEQQRIVAEYRRRENEIAPDLYAPWQPASAFLRAGRSRKAASLLRLSGAFPAPGDACLEVGYGSLGWLGELIAWGIREKDLHGIELDALRAARAKEILPGADLRVGDATRMPWGDSTFRLIVVSTVFSSILDERIRSAAAAEIVRVLMPGGAMLWYDMRVRNPRNPNVRPISRRALTELFPGLTGPVRSVTLAPPLARWCAPKSWVLAEVLESLPVCRTHLIAALSKR
jgi:SAM-dependent methyltransferase